MKKALPILLSLASLSAGAQNLDIKLLGRYTDGREAACEISTYDKSSKKIFVTNAAADSIDVVDITDLSNPVKINQIDVLSYGGGVNSVVSLGNGYIAAAIEASPKQNEGVVVFYDTAGTFITKVDVGALPDMISLSHDKNTLVVANEGEPSDDYLIDPEGSVSFIDISDGISGLNQTKVTTVNFVNAPSTIPGSINKPGVTWQYDLEPEYIAVSDNDSIAFVICQENNVLITFDMLSKTILSYNGLGFKDHALNENKLDASNRDNGINIQNWNVQGVYQPDAIASYSVNGKHYIVSANEGDGRDYSGYSSETRIKDLMLDSIAFPNYAHLQADSNLGRLKTFTEDVIGDENSDGYVETLYSYGARSFSIWDENAAQVYDSGDDFEMYVKDNHDSFFNCSDGLASEKDDRSDDKGPEPEAVVVGKIRTQSYAFIGLERQGGIMVYNISDPLNPVFESYVHTLDEISGTMTDIAPEGLLFISAENSHIEKNLLLVSNEFSGTVAIYEIEDLFSGIENNSNPMVLNVYPNPTSGEITISAQNYDEVMNYSIMNAMGRSVATGSIKTEKTSLDIGHLPSGLYFITIHSLRNNSVIQNLRVILN